jgi:hypothetical protein
MTPDIGVIRRLCSPVHDQVVLSADPGDTAAGSRQDDW